MMRTLSAIIFSLLLCLGLRAQTELRGTVLDSISGKPVAAASVTLLRHGNPRQFVRSDANGRFSLTIPIQKGDSLNVTCLGFARKRVAVPFSGVAIIKLTPRAFELSEVQVRGNRVIGRADTTVYDLTRFADVRDNSLKDVLRKLPGVEIGDDGTIQVNGKNLSRFTVEGLDMTGGRYNQLEENIKAKDVKKAEVIDHDQPIKALQDKVFTDNVAMNIVMKDSVRDKILLTLKPYLLIGVTKTAGGEANAMQIGKKRQLGYDAAYDRTGKDLSQQTNVQGTWRSALNAAEIPSWLYKPTLSAPIDAERLRFNTSQRYAANRIQKNGDNELRLSAHYLRSVERQETENESSYNLGGDNPTTTSQQQRLTLRNDNLSIEFEQKRNTENAYGNTSFHLSAQQADGISSIADTLSQRIKLPNINIVGNLYKLYTIGKNQLTINAVADFHYGKSELHVNDFLSSLQTNLWHAAASIGWLRKRTYFTHRLTALVEAQNMNIEGNVAQYGVTLTPYWQYKRNPWLVGLSAHGRFERYPHQNETFFLGGGSAYIRWQGESRGEWHLSVNYNERTGDVSTLVLRRMQKDYRTYFTTDGTMPKNRSLYGSLQYLYRRPLTELFFNANINAGRTWSNVSNGLAIYEGKYYLALINRPSRSTFAQTEGAVSKGFFALHLKTRLAASVTYNKGEQITASHPLGEGGREEAIIYETAVCRLSPNIEFSSSWCTMSYNGNFQWQHSARMTTLFNWKQSLSITSTIRQVDIGFSLTHYHNELQLGNTLNNTIGDAKIVWRTKKLRATLTLSNIFNKHEYTLSQYGGISTTTDSYYLRGREMLASLQFSL